MVLVPITGEMAARLVLAWIAFTVVLQAGFYWLMRALSPTVYSYTELVSLFSILAVPVAQWGALKVYGVPWRREWFTASLAGLVLASTVVNLLWSRVALVAIPLPAMFLLVFSEVIEALLQWVVLRAHVRRPSIWVAAVAATIASTFGLRWLMTGTVMPAALPNSVWARLAIPATAALIQSACFAWLLTSRRESEVSLRSKPAWFVVEWTTAAGVGMLIILGGASVMAALGGRGGGLTTANFVMLPLLAGLVVGTLQWMLQRGRLPVGLSWVAVSAAAMGIPAAGILVPAILPYVGYFWFMALVTPHWLAGVGAWIGLAQWLILRRHVAMAFLWVPTSALAWPAWHLRYVGVNGLTIGVIAGLLTGVVMAVLLRHTKPSPAAQPHSPRGLALQS